MLQTERGSQVAKNSSLIKPTTGGRKQKILRYLPLCLMALPGFAYLIINNYLPMFGTVMAFKKINWSLGIWQSPWVGTDNFKFLFSGPDALIATRNSILYNLAFIVINTIMAVGIAILLNEIGSRMALKFYQSMILLPYLISMVVVSYIVYGFLNGDTGFINKTFYGGEGPRWYSTSSYWPFIIILVNTWKQTGYLCVIYLASVIGIDTSLYEAATLDGASKWQQICHITLPCLKPTIVTMTLLAVGRIFYTDFGLFYQVPMNSGALYSTTQTMDTFVYRGLMTLGNPGMASAAGLYQAVIGFILVFSVNLLVRRYDRDNALF